MGEFVRSFRLPGPTGRFALLSLGDFLIHRKPSGLPDERASLFYLMSPTGEELHRFGEPGREIVELDLWIVSPVKSGGFWTASMWEYEATYWAEVDSSRLTLRRIVEWFPSGGKFDPNMYIETPPPPQLHHVWEDDAQRLWIYAVVPDADWKPDAEGFQWNPRWIDRTFDTMIEVIDLRDGKLIAESRHERWLGPVCNSNLMYEVIETDMGDTRVGILEPTLSDEHSTPRPRSR
jgi:hypothetical protein